MAERGAPGDAGPGDFRERQFEFAAHLRDPERFPAPADVEDRRMQIYRDLFFNNITAFLERGFPVAAGCMGQDAWRAMMRDFYRDHASRTPLFTKLAQEFLLYLSAERGKRPGDPPFLAELAHYESIRSELTMAPDPEPDAMIDPDGDLLDGCPAISPLVRGVSYRYAVNEISRYCQPVAPLDAPLHLLAYRNDDDEVEFIKLNAVSARLFELIDTTPSLTGRRALERIAEELQHPNAAAVHAGGRDMLSQWRRLGILRGARKSS